MGYSKKYIIISDTLGKSRKVNSFNSEHERESDVLAHAFLDIEEACSTFLNELLPKLTQNELSEEEINDILWDIGEEFRHILYHIKDPRFYEYLKTESS